MNFKKSVLAIATASVGFGAQAVTISSTSPYSFSWVANGGAITGNGTMTFTGFGSTALNVGVTLNNTSGLSTNRLVSFGFGIDPNVSSVGFSDASDAGIIGAKLGTLPSLSTIEVCAYSGPNCNGGGSGGILGGGSDAFTLTLNRLTRWGSAVVIDPIGFKYQTANGSFEFTAVTAVPEPETYAMLLAGLGLIGSIVRRRSSKSA